MKKRKTYEVSVINKTYSKTYSDQTKFYTSDTALELDFQLKEVEYDFDSAEIILLNIDDRSLVTRPVSKTALGFTYELEDDITARFGEWKGQLKFNEGGEIYVSSPVSFRIENDLDNDRPPQLTEVNSWKNLRAIADGLIADMQSELESITKQASEIEGAETTRQQAEAQRASAELSRVSAEEQRKIDHANRSAELAGKANKKQEDWLYPTITNGTADITSTPSFYKDEFGVVHLSGKINNLAGTRLTLFTLPTGYRPNTNEGYSVVTGGGSFGYASINSAGLVTMITGNIAYMLISGITFKAER